MKSSLLALATLMFSGLFVAPASATPTYFADAQCYDFSFNPIPCQIDMQNFGGPTMTGTTDVYDIWYGNWWSDLATVNTLGGFFSSLTGSDYMNIAATYGVSNNIVYKGGLIVNPFLGTSLSDADLGTLIDIMTNPVNNTGMTAENNAIYFIYTTPDISEEEDQFACGFHSDATGLKFAWIGSLFAQQGDGCGDATFAQNITSISSHELFETLTDPLVNEAFDYAPPLAWYDGGPTNQGEVGDMCSQSSFSANLNGGQYWVQSIFVPDPNYTDANGAHPGGYCASENHLAVAAPEPITLSLFGAGVAGLAALRRRKKKIV